ncbi:cytochrome P450 [Saccharopolyspora taberi]|uniref:Cytochrome P450 n=1 Tax=Saccharopolyspora taberi TaxID=60895 RepID=A0ABN3VIJ2_9PSEU
MPGETRACLELLNEIRYPSPLEHVMLFDPLSEEFVADPFPAYRELREQYPVCYHEPTDQWLISRYDDVKAVLTDRRIVHTYRHCATDEEMGRTPPPEWQAPLWRVVYGSLAAEPPVHDRIRRQLNPAFQARRTDRLRARSAELADQLVDRFVRDGEGDLMAQVTEPLALTVIGEIIGIPAADRRMVRAWAKDPIDVASPKTTDDDLARAVNSASELERYLLDLVDWRRNRPAEPDLLGSLLEAEAAGKMEAVEIAHSVAMLAMGGVDSVHRSNAVSCVSLHRHPDQWELLRDDPGLLPNAVRELIRYDTSVHSFERYALEDFPLRGRNIPKGAQLAVLFVSANRDPANFDDPDRLDITREPSANLAFGAGLHYCLAARLAEVQMAALHSALLRKAPQWKLLSEPQWGPTFELRGPMSLHVST